MTRPPRPCSHCGTEFTPRTHRQKACSRACGRAAAGATRRNPAPKTTVACPACGRVVVHDAALPPALQKSAFANHAH